MADKLQTTVGGTATIPAGATHTYRHRADGEMWVSVVRTNVDALEQSVRATMYVSPETGGNIPIQTKADDGPDSPESDIGLPSVPTRWFTLIRLEQGDELVFRFENTDSAEAFVLFDAAVAGTVEVALSNRGSD